ncbi:MAG TPA: hypothetical protein VG248_03855 [Caulobacteraceae bacterium]|jgi:hypothetical protein|nr:hypothetical protein [Caulobacteraceae bacterium]
MRRIGGLKGAAMAVGLALAALSGWTGTAQAVPAFAVQTGQPCSGCHVGGFGPQLTPYGREFKMRGYTTRAVDFNVPVSAMAVASYVHTLADQPQPPHYAANDNLTVDQVSLFLAGGAGHFGAFVQATYDGVARAFHWDNLDLRATTDAHVGATKMVLGMSLNNAPTVQDPFNTLAAWGHPFTSSDLGPSPAAGPIIGALAQNTIGLTGYAWIDSHVYAEFGGYRSPGAGFLTRAGVDPNDPGNISGVAPYGRIAWQNNLGDYNYEIGASVLAASIYPGRYATSGPTDRYVDLGVDGSFQLYAGRRGVVSVDGRYTWERQTLDASNFLGMAANTHDHLTEARIDASYFWRNKVGFTLGAFDIRGSNDPVLYGDNRVTDPNSAGLMFQVDGSPFGAGRSPLGPRFNMKVGVQYTAYLMFDGAAHDYDGFGHNAADNNTVRVFTWIAY